MTAPAECRWSDATTHDEVVWDRLKMLTKRTGKIPDEIIKSKDLIRAERAAMKAEAAQRLAKRHVMEARG